jgi:hypothetical protein
MNVINRLTSVSSFMMRTFAPIHWQEKSCEGCHEEVRPLSFAKLRTLRPAHDTAQAGEICCGSTRPWQKAELCVCSLEAR